MLTFYTDRLPDGVAGKANGPIIRIRPKYRGDMGLLAHEREHVRQWLFTLGVHPILYALSREYRMWSEAKAYAEQIRHPRADGSLMRLEEAAERMTRSMYRLGITQDQAEQAILQFS